MNIGKWIVSAVILLLSALLAITLFILLKRKRSQKNDLSYDESFEDTVDLDEEADKADKSDMELYSTIKIIEDIVVTHYRK